MRKSKLTAKGAAAKAAATKAKTEAAAAATAEAPAEEKETRKHRAKGTGYLEKRGKVWLARWTVNGRRFCRSTEEGDKDKADAKLKAWTAPFRLKDEEATLKALAAKVEGVRRSGDALRVADAFAAYESGFHSRWSASTRTHYAGRFEAFARWLAEQHPEVEELRAISPEVAREFMKGISAKKSAKTFNDYRAILLQMWNALAEEAKCEGKNPFEGIPRKERDTFRRRELTVEELARVLSSVNGEMRVLFAIGIYTGLRLGDAVRLSWGDVDLVRGFVTVKPRKTEKHGTIVRIPLPATLRAVLLETPPAKRCGPIVPGLLGIYSTTDTRLVTRVQAVFEAAGIRTTVDGGRGRKAVEVGFHSLRHTYVSLAANAGVPLAVVQSIVGHSNAAMTEHYFHVSDSALRGAAAALPDVTGGGAVAALPAPSKRGAPDRAAAEAVEGFRTACARLASARLTKAQWREVSAILAEAKRRA